MKPTLIPILLFMLMTGCKPDHHHIEKIEYGVTSCYQPCPTYRIIINKDLTCSYNVWVSNKINGEYSTKVSRAYYQQLIDILTYIHFEQMDSSYNLPIADLQNGVLRITYDNGKVKEIYDYGNGGTDRLQYVYQKLYKIKDSPDKIH